MYVNIAQVPGQGVGDDRAFAGRNSLVVLDGASAFVPVPVPASTYADALGRHIRKRLVSNSHARLDDLLAESIRDTSDELRLIPGASPSSTVTILRQTGDRLELLMLGDNTAVLPWGTITDTRMDDLDLEPRRQYQARLATGCGYDDTHKAILRDLQTQQGKCRNVDGGYWIAEADPEAAHHAHLYEWPVEQVPWLILMTDGAYNPMTHLGTVDWPDLAHASGSRLDAVLRDCDDWEANTDPNGQQLPRAKRHDDKTLATVVPAQQPQPK